MASRCVVVALDSDSIVIRDMRRSLTPQLLKHSFINCDRKLRMKKLRILQHNAKTAQICIGARNGRMQARKTKERTNLN